MLPKEDFCIITTAPDDFALGEPDCIREKKWIQEVVHSFLVRADDDASNELQLFKTRLETELGSSGIDKQKRMFDEYREEVLKKHRQISSHILFTDHWQKKGGYSEDMLIGLADSVRMRYLNMGGFGKAGEVMMQLYHVYSSHFLLLQLNDFEETALASTSSILSKKPKRINKVAQDNHKRVIAKYELYTKSGYTYAAAIQSLVHDFRLEYGKGTPEHTKKVIQAIIRRNIKE